MRRQAGADRELAPNARSAPPVLLPYQQAWVADKSEVAVWEKSRRIGASWCDASDSVLGAAAAGGQDALYIGYSEDMTREYIDDCAMWARAFNLFASEMNETVFVDTDKLGRDPKEIKAFRIDFASGSKVLALSSRPRSIRGKQGKVTIDEAAFHDDLPGLLKAALALLIWGGKVRILSSHNGAQNPFNELVLSIRAKKVPYSMHRTTFDDALAAGLYRRVCLKRGIAWTAAGEVHWRTEILKKYGDSADEELHCIPSHGTGIWIPRALIEARMVEDLRVVRFRPPKGADLWPEEHLRRHVEDFCERELRPLLDKLDPELRSAIGVDFARRVDLSVFAPNQVRRDLVRRFPFLLELADCPFKAQEQIFYYICDRLPRFAHGMLDAGGNGSFLAEQARNKYGEARITAVVFSETWYRENTGAFKAAFEDAGVQLPKDGGVADDLAAFRIVNGVPRLPATRTTDQHGQKRHGDAGIACLLSYMASRQDDAPIEFMSSGAPRVGYGLADFVS